MERIHRTAERIATLGAYVGGTMILAAAVVVTFEVISRKLFNFSIAGADELSGYAYALSMAWGYSYALFCRAHIRVDAVYARLPFAARCALDVLAVTSLAVLMALLSVRAIGVFADTIEMNAKANTPLSTPLWIPQSVWVVGIGFFTLCLILFSLRSAYAFLRGDLSLVRDIAHGRSADDSAGSEIVGPGGEGDGGLEPARER